MADAKFIKVADVYVVEDGGKYVGVEFGFTDAVVSTVGAATALDFVRGALNSSGWVTQTVMRVEDKGDAQTEPEGESDGGEDAGLPPEPEVGGEEPGDDG